MLLITFNHKNNFLSLQLKYELLDTNHKIQVNVYVIANVTEFVQNEIPIMSTAI